MSANVHPELEESCIAEDMMLEYQEAMSHHRADSLLRRQGLAFAASFQIVAIAALSQKVALSDLQALLVSLLALAVCLVSLNHDIRLTNYQDAYEKRILEIEGTRIRLMHTVMSEVHNKHGFPLTNTAAFCGFYIGLSVAWGFSFLAHAGTLVTELFGRP